MQAARIAAMQADKARRAFALQHARRRTVVGTTATRSVISSSSSPRVVLERDISDAAWQFLGLISSAAAGQIAYHDGTEWVLLDIGAEGQRLQVVSGEPKWVTP